MSYYTFVLRRPEIILGYQKAVDLPGSKDLDSGQLLPLRYFLLPRKGMMGFGEKKEVWGSVHFLYIQTAHQIEYLHHYKKERKKTCINQDK